jgi:RNA polymerase sigma factor (sigma-70 family)
LSPNTPDNRLRILTEIVQENDEKLSGWVRSWLRSRSGQPTKEEVQDVLSDAFVTAITKLRDAPELEIHFPFAWFLRILFFTSLRHARRHLHVIQRLELEDRLLNRIVDPTVSNSESRLVIDNAVKTAAGDDLEIIQLAAQGYTSEEIGEKLDISPELVRKRKSRALQRLRLLLETNDNG